MCQQPNWGSCSLPVLMWHERFHLLNFWRLIKDVKEWGFYYSSPRLCLLTPSGAWCGSRLPKWQTGLHCFFLPALREKRGHVRLSPLRSDGLDSTPSKTFRRSSRRGCENDIPRLSFLFQMFSLTRGNSIKACKVSNTPEPGLIYLFFKDAAYGFFWQKKRDGRRLFARPAESTQAIAVLSKWA